MNKVKTQRNNMQVAIIIDADDLGYLMELVHTKFWDGTPYQEIYKACEKAQAEVVRIKANKQRFDYWRKA